MTDNEIDGVPLTVERGLAVGTKRITNAGDRPVCFGPRGKICEVELLPGEFIEVDESAEIWGFAPVIKKGR